MKDFRLQGQQLVGTSCEDMHEVLHPETCISSVRLNHDNTKTLQDWICTPPNGSSVRTIPTENSLYQWLCVNWEAKEGADLSDYYTKEEADEKFITEIPEIPTVTEEENGLVPAFGNEDAYFIGGEWTELEVKDIPEGSEGYKPGQFYSKDGVFLFFTGEEWVRLKVEA